MRGSRQGKPFHSKSHKDYITQPRVVPPCGKLPWGSHRPPIPYSTLKGLQHQYQYITLIERGFVAPSSAFLMQPLQGWDGLATVSQGSSFLATLAE